MKVRKSGKGKVNAIRICQKTTGMSYKSGKKSKGGKKSSGSLRHMMKEKEREKMMGIY